jgi:putative membrane protein
MKLKLLAIVTLSLFTSAYAIAEDTTDKTQDQKIIGTLITLNKNELAAANYIAGKKDVSPDVKKFAKWMAKEHSKNLQETMKLSHTIGKPIMSTDATDLKKQGAEELTSLKGMKGKEVQTQYMDDMVKDHEGALTLIDDNLLKNVNNTELKQLLQDTRTHVDHHLQEAKEIQSKLPTA